MRYTWTEIARIVHDTNCVLESAGNDPAPSPPWDAEPHDLKTRVRRMCVAAAQGRTPAQIHEQWRQALIGAGWKPGPIKDWDLKTHPWLVPWERLPDRQQDKTRALVAMVGVLTTDPICLIAVTGAVPLDVLTPADQHRLWFDDDRARERFMLFLATTNAASEIPR